jgi:hypothetical protein
VVVSKGGHGWQPGFHGSRRAKTRSSPSGEIGRTKRHRAADTLSRLPGFNRPHGRDRDQLFFGTNAKRFPGCTLERDKGKISIRFNLTGSTRASAAWNIPIYRLLGLACRRLPGGVELPSAFALDERAKKKRCQPRERPSLVLPEFVGSPEAPGAAV